MEEREYTEEIELIREQNHTEFEIYPLAVEIIQSTTINLSKRYVFARKKSARGQIYYGLSSFPDVAILEKGFRNVPNTAIREEEWRQLKGCLEVKALGAKLIDRDSIMRVCSEKPEELSKDMGQLIGEILWYKKVLYTNGLEWRYLLISEYTEQLKKVIIDTVAERIRAERDPLSKDFDWWKRIRSFDFRIEDKTITEDCTKNWETFINEISKITWE